MNKQPSQPPGGPGLQPAASPAYPQAYGQQFRVKICKKHWYKWVCLYFCCDALQWTIKSLLASSEGLERSTARYEEGTTALPIVLPTKLNTEHFSSTRLLASFHRSNSFCFLFQVFRDPCLLGQPLTDMNYSPELSSSRACLAAWPSLASERPLCNPPETTGFSAPCGGPAGTAPFQSVGKGLFAGL